MKGAVIFSLSEGGVSRLHLRDNRDPVEGGKYALDERSPKSRYLKTIMIHRENEEEVCSSSFSSSEGVAIALVTFP